MGGNDEGRNTDKGRSDKVKTGKKIKESRETGN